MTHEEPSRRDVLRNGLWASALGGVNSIAGSVVALLLVLVLPVDQYGLYSYATAVSAIGMAVAQGGLASLATRMLVGVTPKEARTTVGLITAARLTFALAGYLIIVLISLTSGAFPTIAAVLIAGMSLFARSANGADFWYQAKLRTQVPASVRIAASTVTLVARLAALWLWPSVWLFLVLFVAEHLIGTFLVWLRYSRDRSAPGVSRPTIRGSFEVARRSMPLVLSGLANQVTLRGNVVILQVLSGNVAVAVFSLAVRVSELAQVIPSSFLNSTLPVMVSVRDRWGAGHRKYMSLLQGAYDRAFWLGVGVAIPVGLAGSFLIPWLFDPVYEPAVSILWIQLASCPFVFMSLVYSKWIIAEGVLWLSLVRHGVGAVLSVGLNIFLIPVLGLEGAALAALISYIFASYISAFFSARSLPAGVQMTLAMLAPLRFCARLFRRGV